MLAVPDFGQAMENTAAIFYREGAPRRHRDGVRHRAGNRAAWSPTRWPTSGSAIRHDTVVGRPVAQRGFASWMDPSDGGFATGGTSGVDEARASHRAIDLDSRATHPIHTPCGRRRIDALDTITYQKGAAVVRMIEHYVGADAFRTASTRI
jgi:aminopeptidase N